ncbi:MAG: hypothetical protein ACOCRK_06470 [bacterium]
MLYKTKDEKEMFINLLPQINKIKDIYKENGLVSSRNLVDCINNEIHHCCQEENMYKKRLSNGRYKKYLKNIPSKEIKQELEAIIGDIKKDIEQFTKEYFEKI